ncbi:MAG: hypothetical protein AVDCRST_MAG19-479 [uncultured Thermomicrobiales bacterium]|uniref:Uncharacterized protein n=1 Tax=uncultured Thermomicrobiales bacterium TaxID=1645740 RepID=A0A6J4UDM4_9BACT|nr:MAG: hypothetical protein AVDCRST_MAG19-479 [uncultured Thermomicrobiales bacterium]
MPVGMGRRTPPAAQAAAPSAVPLSRPLGEGTGERRWPLSPRSSPGGSQWPPRRGMAAERAVGARSEGALGTPRSSFRTPSAGVSNRSATGSLAVLSGPKPPC